MIRSLGVIVIAALAAIWPASIASAQLGFGIHIGDDHDDHHGRRHHRHHDDDGFSIHIGDGHYFDRHHHHHSGWEFVLPHYDHHYHGSYYWDDGINYYVPRTYVTDRRAYVAAKPVVIEFGGYAHIDDLSGRLERLANELCLELHYNYRHNRGFADTYREAYQILSTAKYIHAKEHQGDREEVARRLDELDGLFHHVESDMKGWSRRHVRQIGQAGAQSKLEAVEATLHHLMNDVGVKGVHGEPETVASPVEGEAAPPPVPVPVPPARN